MKVAIGADHGGYTQKSDIVKVLDSLGHDSWVMTHGP